MEISTAVKKYDPIYNITFRLYKKSDISNAVSVTTKKSFGGWFDEEGAFVKKPFDNWLGINIIEVEKKLTAGKERKRK